MSNSNKSDIDSLLADYSEQVAQFGLNSPQEKQFYADHSSDGEFVELAGVLRHLRESPPRIHSTDEAGSTAMSRIRLAPTSLVGAFVLLLGSTTWLAIDRVMDKRGFESLEIASMNALSKSVPSEATDDKVTEIVANDHLVDNSKFDWKITNRLQLLERQSPGLEYAKIAAKSNDAEKYEYEAMPFLWSLDGSSALATEEGDPHARTMQYPVVSFMSDATTANLLAENFLHDAKASQPINLPKLNIAYAFARLAVSLDTAVPDAGSDDSVQSNSGRILDTYGHVLDTIMEVMRDNEDDGFILMLDLSSGEAWQRIIADFETSLERPTIDEESRARVRQRIKALTNAGSKRKPAKDGN